jgi:hypothetical protein
MQELSIRWHAVLSTEWVLNYWRRKENRQYKRKRMKVIKIKDQGKGEEKFI